jgi:hypothetical protein
MNRFVIVILLFFSLFSCQGNQERQIIRILTEWDGKEVLFPKNSVFSVQGKDTVDYRFDEAEYKILCYVDSTGCFSCKLHLERWQEFMFEIDSLGCNKVAYLFYFQTKNLREMQSVTRRYNFRHPVCFDEKDSLNILNHFPTDMNFQTFLLNQENRVVAIGNPILNPQIKELYLNIIQGKETITGNDTAQTEVSVDKTTISMGTFDWKQSQQCSFILTNVGRHPLHITDVTTSCSCTTVAFTHEAVAPGETTELKITYEAERPETFLREITVYCNAPSSPLQLEISGIAKICEIDRIPR